MQAHDGPLQVINLGRVEFKDGVRERDLEDLASDPTVTVLQTPRAVSDATWDALNESFFSRRPDVELRVYGHYGRSCDLRFASRLSNVRRFAADSLTRAEHVECIADIPELESLSLGVFELRDFDVLQLLGPTLTSLSLYATRSTRPELSALERFPKITTLQIEGHNKNIDVLSGLSGLKDLTLRSVTTPDLAYLRPLDHLSSLDIKLGGIRSFVGIEGKTSIHYLELWQIRECADIRVISTLGGLQNLFLQSLPRLDALPSLRECVALRRVSLMNLKGMHDFAELEWAPALEEFALIEGLRQQPEELLPVLRNPSVQRVVAGFGSDRKNSQFETLRERSGKAPLRDWGEFGFAYR